MTALELEDALQRLRQIQEGVEQTLYKTREYTLNVRDVLSAKEVFKEDILEESELLV